LSYEPDRRYKIPRRTPSEGPLHTRGWENAANTAFMSQMVQDRPTVTMEHCSDVNKTKFLRRRPK